MSVIDGRVLEPSSRVVINTHTQEKTLDILSWTRYNVNQCRMLRSNGENKLIVNQEQDWMKLILKDDVTLKQYKGRLMS